MDREIIEIDETDKYYYVHLNNGAISRIKKGTELDDSEILIGIMCRKLLSYVAEESN